MYTCIQIVELGIGGGWVAGVMNKNQYFQVDMKEPYKFTKIHIQGMDGEAQWVTSFRVFYTDVQTDAWTLYSNSAGETVSFLVLEIGLRMEYSRENKFVVNKIF